MATTIKVDGTVAGFTWQDDQLLEPLADVDLFVLSADLTEGWPTSAPLPPATMSGGSGTDTLSTKSATTTKAKK